MSQKTLVDQVIDEIVELLDKANNAAVRGDYYHEDQYRRKAERLERMLEEGWFDREGE